MAIREAFRRASNFFVTTGGASDSSPYNLKKKSCLLCSGINDVGHHGNPMRNAHSPVGNDRFDIITFSHEGSRLSRFRLFSGCECRKGTAVPVTSFKRKMVLKKLDDSRLLVVLHLSELEEHFGLEKNTFGFTLSPAQSSSFKIALGTRIQYHASDVANCPGTSRRSFKEPREVGQRKDKRVLAGYFCHPFSVLRLAFGL